MPFLVGELADLIVAHALDLKKKPQTAHRRLTLVRNKSIIIY